MEVRACINAEMRGANARRIRQWRDVFLCIARSRDHGGQPRSAALGHAYRRVVAGEMERSLLDARRVRISDGISHSVSRIRNKNEAQLLWIITNSSDVCHSSMRVVPDAMAGPRGVLWKARVGTNRDLLEVLENFMEMRGHLIHRDLRANGTVISIAQPIDEVLQRFAYNGHKRKHAIKFQAVSASDGLILNAYKPI
eukprot:IDg16121t1